MGGVLDIIKANFVRDYLAEDMGVRLDPLPLDDQPPFAGQSLRSPANDNPTLYHAQWIAALYEADALEATDEARFATMMRLYRDPRVNGLYLRHPGNTSMVEAHDDHVGIAIGAKLCGYTADARVLAQALELAGWQVGNDPLQGGDRAVIKLCADIPPTIDETVWLCVALIVAILFGKNHSKALANLRVTAIKKVLREQGTNIKYPGSMYFHLPQWCRIALSVTGLVFVAVAAFRYGSRLLIPKRMYFRPDHPICQVYDVVAVQGER